MLESVITNLKEVEQQLRDAQDIFQLAKLERDGMALGSIGADVLELERTVKTWNSVVCSLIPWILITAS